MKHKKFAEDENQKTLATSLAAEVELIAEHNHTRVHGFHNRI